MIGDDDVVDSKDKDSSDDLLAGRGIEIKELVFMTPWRWKGLSRADVVREMRVDVMT